MKTRAMLCMLLVLIMVSYAWPKLSFNGQGLVQVFAVAWLSFAALVISGNAVAWVQAHKKSRKKIRLQKETAVKRARQFG